MLKYCNDENEGITDVGDDEAEIHTSTSVNQANIVYIFIFSICE